MSAAKTREQERHYAACASVHLLPPPKPTSDSGHDLVISPADPFGVRVAFTFDSHEEALEWLDAARAALVKGETIRRLIEENAA